MLRHFMGSSLFGIAIGIGIEKNSVVEAIFLLNAILCLNL